MSITCTTQLIRLLLGLLFGVFISSPLSTEAQELHIMAKLNVANGDIKGTMVRIIENGKEVSNSYVKRKRLKLELTFGNQYILQFEKEGHVTKEVLVDTRNVPLHMREEYLDFGFEVELHKETAYPQLESDSLKMARWRYMVEYGVFDFQRIDECLASKVKSVPTE